MNRPFVLIRNRDRDHPTPQHPLCLYLFSVGLEYAGEALVRSGFAVETVDLLPLYHAKEVYRALIQDGLGEKIRWYCYCAPIHFDQELAISFSMI